MYYLCSVMYLLSNGCDFMCKSTDQSVSSKEQGTHVSSIL